jgi:hypothetical protein
MWCVLPVMCGLQMGTLAPFVCIHPALRLSALPPSTPHWALPSPLPSPPIAPFAPPAPTSRRPNWQASGAWSTLPWRHMQRQRGGASWRRPCWKASGGLPAKSRFCLSWVGAVHVLLAVPLFAGPHVPLAQCVVRRLFVQTSARPDHQPACCWQVDAASRHTKVPPLLTWTL